MLKAIIHISLVFANNINTEYSKYSLTGLEFLINMYNIYCKFSAYIAGMIFTYITYKNRSDECFMSTLIFNI